MIDAVIDAWLDLVAGSACVGCARPGRLLCRECAEALPPRAHQTSPTPCPPGLAECWVGADYDGAVREMVLAHKERRAFALADPLAGVLARAVRGAVDRPSLIGVRVLLVPVPSRAEVVRARGHDPMRRVTRRAATTLRAEQLDVAEASLLRIAGRPADQADLDAGQRRANLRHTMAGRTPALARLARSGAEVVAVVCDDVLTTGSTAAEAQRALQAVGVPVAGIACVAGTVLRHPRSVVDGRQESDISTVGTVDPSPRSH